jgi:hypothetical protein
MALELLPPECVDLVVSYLSFDDLKICSLVNRRLRAFCYRYLFHSVKIQFSMSAFHGLSQMAPEIGKYIRYVRYEVPDLLKKGRASGSSNQRYANNQLELLDFPTFANHLYPYADYLAESQERSTLGMAPHPPYQVMFEELARICREQREILDQSLDLESMIAILDRLPRLKAVDMTFKSAAPQWLRPLLYRGMTADDEGSYQHHVRVVLNALGATGNYTFELKDLQLARAFLERYPKFCHISRSIPYIIHPTDAIRYERAGMVLQALAQYPLDATLCDEWIARSAFEIFLAYHSDSSMSLLRDTFMSAIQSPVDDGDECTFSIWERGWCLRVQKEAA